MRRAPAALLLAALMTLPAAPAAAVEGADDPTIRDGGTPETSVFPSDAFSVPDERQLTGRRVALPKPTDCSAAVRSICDDIDRLNELDGFDLQPRVSIPFSEPVDLSTVTPATIYVEGPGGSRTGLRQLVSDPATGTLTGTTDALLVENARHTVVVTGDVRGADGGALDVPAGGLRTDFTTMSGSSKLVALAQAVDDGSAYTEVAIPASDRMATLTVDGGRRVFPAATSQVFRSDQTNADPDAPLTPQNALTTARAGVSSYGFGSFLSPRFTSSLDLPVIAAVPSRERPAAVAADRIGFTLIVPAGPMPAGGWPVAVFGPGFTRSKFDVFLAADANAARGIATVATDPLGHSYGPASTVTVGPTRETGVTFSSFGRGRDLDGDGKIAPSEGVSPTVGIGVDGSVEPSPFATVANRDGLIQTAVDNMALRRAVAGLDVSPAGDGSVRLSVAPSNYFGQSFGGIYGTMLLGSDPTLTRAALNVPGGPITEIARTSGFRAGLQLTLGANRPSLLNGGPGLNGFTEDLPLRLDPPVTAPRAGALAIQGFVARQTWVGRPGNPETFAPLLRLRPRDGLVKDPLYQIAFGDGTVPNQTSGTLIRAGDLFDRTTYYRNDRTPTFTANPHGFLLDPTITPGRNQAQLQIIEFLVSGNVIDPDGATPVFEVPIANRLNLDCLHYADPQTGRPRAGQANGPECVDNSVVAAPGPTPVVPEAPLPVLLVALGLAGIGAVAVRQRRLAGAAG